MRSRTRPGRVRPPAIVIGLDCLQGLQSARILAGRGIPVIGIAKDPSHYAVSTRVCETIMTVDTGGPALVDLLVELGPTFGSRPVLFPCQDKNVLVLSRARERLDAWYSIALAEPEVVETLADKASFHEYGASVGLPLPPTYVLRDRADAEHAAARLPYPSILKPSVRLRDWSKHTKLKALAPTPLRSCSPTTTSSASGPASSSLSSSSTAPTPTTVTCNSYFDGHGELAVSFTTRKIRQWPPKTRQACSSEEVRDDEAVELTRQVFGGIGYRGLAYLESKRDEVTGEHAIIEATNVVWLHVMRDLQAAVHHWRRRELTVRRWWRTVRGPRTHAIASWRDPVPFVKAIRSAIPELWPSNSARRRSITHVRGRSRPKMAP